MLLEKLNADRIKFMKEKKQLELNLVRVVLTEIKNKEIDLMRPIQDHEVLAILSIMVKNVKETLENAEKNNRQDSAEQAIRELDLLKTYMPKEMTADEVRYLATKIITDGGYSGKKDLGKVMQTIRPQTVGRADGKLVSKIVSELLK
jgi:uncharacterized protein YqeY